MVMAFCLCACAHRGERVGEWEPAARPADPRVPSRAELAADRAANRAYWDARAALDPAVDSESAWVSHGPQNLAGVTYALLFDPDPNVLWSASAEALWRSSDRGATWRVVPELDGFFVSSLARDANPNILYAGTGLFDDTARGIFRSVDRGATWSLLASSAGRGAIGTIATDPAHAGTLLIATTRGIFRSVDASENWTNTLPGSADIINPQVAYDPVDPSRAIATITRVGAGASFYYSNDGGATWSEAAGISGADASAATSAYAPSQPSRVYAVTVNAGTAAGKVWRSDDGGHTFARVADVSGIAAGGVLAHLWVSPVDPAHILFSGVFVYASRNGGTTLQEITLQRPTPFIAYPHLDVHGIASDPGYNGSTNRRLYAWTDGGVFRTDAYDVPAPVWTPLLRAHQSTQFYAVDVNAAGAIVGGMQDTGAESQPPGATDGAHLLDGDITMVAFDPLSTSRYYLGSFGALYRSDDLYTPVADPGAGAPRYFEIPTALDPNDPARLFVASGTVLRVEWVGGTARTTTIRAADGVTIAAIAVQRGNSNVVWIVNHSGIVYRTDNALAAAPVWTEVHREPTYYPTRILIDRDDPSTVYVSSLSPGLIKTTNGGASWSAANGIAPATIRNVYDIERHPSDRLRLYAGTEAGLYASGDGGRTWAIAKFGAPSMTAVRDVKFRPGTSTLFVSTYGRGIWSYDTSIPAGKRRSARH